MCYSPGEGLLDGLHGALQIGDAAFAGFDRGPSQPVTNVERLLDAVTAQPLAAILDDGHHMDRPRVAVLGVQSEPDLSQRLPRYRQKASIVHLCEIDDLERLTGAGLQATYLVQELFPVGSFHSTIGHRSSIAPSTSFALTCST